MGVWGKSFDNLVRICYTVQHDYFFRRKPARSANSHPQPRRAPSLFNLRGKMKHYIYVLIDPRDDKIRYVGKTGRLPEERLKEHCKKQHNSNYYSYWINKLRSLKLKPIMRVIEECDEFTWEAREIYWIRYYRQLNYDLVNTTEGGGGLVGYKASEETRRKLSYAAKGEKNPNFGKSHSDEAKRKIGESSKLRIHSEETRRKRSKSLRGVAKSEEHKRKISESNKNPSNEIRLKISKANRGSNHGRSKLNESVVIQIKQRIIAGESDGDVANIYKVARKTINDIRHGRRSKHVILFNDPLRREY